MKLLARLTLASVLASLVLAGCNDDSLPPAAGYATLQGTVVDSATKQPIAGAIVTVDTVLTATTDATGTFKIDKVPSGIVDFTVEAKGYTMSQSTTNAEPGKVAVLALTLDVKPPGGN